MKVFFCSKFLVNTQLTNLPFCSRPESPSPGSRQLDCALLWVGTNPPFPLPRCLIIYYSSTGILLPPTHDRCKFVSDNRTPSLPSLTSLSAQWISLQLLPCPWQCNRILPSSHRHPQARHLAAYSRGTISLPLAWLLPAEYGEDLCTMWDLARRLEQLLRVYDSNWWCQHPQHQAFSYLPCSSSSASPPCTP